MPIMGNLPQNQGGLPWIDDGSGCKRVLACLKPQKKYYHIPTLASAFPIIPMSQWREFLDDDSLFRILNQGQHGSCVGHGSCSAMEQAWMRKGGTPRQFSANYLYSLVNGGSDNGAVVGDAADALQKTGICLDATVPEAANKIFTNQMPAGASTEAGRFRAGTIYRITSWEELGTAVQLRLPCATGIDCGQAFSPGADGVMPSQRGSGGGHCINARYGLKNIGGKWYILHQNSWGADWGWNGRMWLDQSYYDGGMGDHYVIAGPLEDPQDPDPDPKITGS
jgi:hypothetical protein